MRGDPARAITHAERFTDLSPFDPVLSSVQASRAHAALRLDDLAQAAAWARASVDHPQTFVTILAPAALILAAAGDMAGAEGAARRLRAMAPDRGAAKVGQRVSAMSEALAALYQQHGDRLEI